MEVQLHPHAQRRLEERGTTEAEIVETVRTGSQFTAKFGRTGFRQDFAFNSEWRGRQYGTKQIEAYAVFEDDQWLVITFITRYF